MRIAIPLQNGRLSRQFKFSDAFALAEVNDYTKEIVEVQTLDMCGESAETIPIWLGMHGVTVVIACGMETQELKRFTSQRIDVVSGIPAMKPEDAARSYLGGPQNVAGNG